MSARTRGLRFGFGTLVGLAGLALAAGCTVAGSEPVELALEVSGTAPTTLLLRDGTQLGLTRAELAFGPLSLCPGDQAGALCDTARLEWREAVVVDALAPAPRTVGALVGSSGDVNSFMYDLGIVSLLGEPGTRLVLPAAEELSGASLWLEGTARLVAASGGWVVPFAARVVVQSDADNEQGVPMVRKSTSDVFFHAVTPDDSALLVRFNAADWVEGLKSAYFVEDAACSAGAGAHVCAQTVELSCDGATELSRRDCSALGLICAPQRGCAQRVEFEEGDAAYRSLVQSLTAGQRPTFEFH